MPRVSREQADKNRERIEAVSAQLFRERGLNGVSVADLMAAAGLTHGGFYGHFESKDELASIACRRAIEHMGQIWEKYIAAAAGDRLAARTAIVTQYLGTEHRDNPGLGCATAALAGDVAREAPDGPVRGGFIAGLKEMVAMWATQLTTRDAEKKRRQALAQVSTLVGALILARAAQGDPLSDEILDAAIEDLVDA
jgi:TetR/AcrR family transcriptional regulator, transcriptional repressor for nem operon